ncbi:MAG: bifunctional pyr operon transcriptional regulator/uracil phosphoribosyltransferase PyrR [Verrucomicrobia bacterium]|jgi:pyrimidine operon attenuation protein / uracil phosphoribosyltransferase|nr:bifunctional pyr operon transcriptional regulator/uracil phosphoribosyltransferase PyrR [Verrucomicrobiota bacterium]
MTVEVTKNEEVFLDAAQTGAMIQTMANSVIEQHPNPKKLAVIGIQQKGVLVADAIKVKLERQWPAIELVSGVLDIGMYRDDLSANPTPTLQPTLIPEHLEELDLVLVDDVLQSGRTIRAALDALRDFGRPRRIQLAVLFDRGQRRLPIQPDYVGRRVDLRDEQFIVVKSLEEVGELEVYLTLK